MAAGDVVAYSFALANTGNVTVTSVALTDAQCAAGTLSLDSGDTAPLGELNTGETFIYSCEHITTQAEIDAGSVDNTASASGTPVGGTLAPVEDTLSLPVGAAPSLTLAKTARPITASEYVIGAMVSYDYLVTNTGNVTITSPISINDNRIAPSDITCPAWPPSSTPTAGLLPGDTYACVGTYEVTSADITLGSVTNVAAATDGTTTSPTDSETVPSDASPAITITKTSVDTSFAAVGDILSYDYAVQNTGTASFVADVTVTDDKIGTLTCWSPTTADPDFTAGETITCSAPYTVTQADLDAGSVTNIAYASTVFQDSTPVTSPTDDLTIDADQTPTLTLVKSDPVNADEDATSTVTLGDTLTYTVTARNTGNVTQTGVIVSDPLLTPSTFSCASVAPNDLCVLTGTLTVDGDQALAGEVVNTASAISNDVTTPVTDSVTTPVANESALGIEKFNPANADEDGSGSITFADTLTYTVTATNTGRGVLTDVTVFDMMLTPGSQTCAQLLPGERCVLTGTYVVDQNDVDTGEIVNTASAISDNTATPVTDTVTTPVVQMGTLTLVKSDPVNSDEDGSESVTFEDTLTYTITATNTGTVTQTNLIVTDGLLTPSSETCASVAPGGTCVLTGSLSVSADQSQAGEVVNTASVVSDQVTNPITDDVTTPVANDRAMTLVKADPVNADEDGTNSVTLGDTLTYTVTATNTGLGIETGVTVFDMMLTPTSETCAQVLPGATCVLSGVYTVDQTDVDAGQIVNTASVVSDGLPDAIRDSVTTPTFQMPQLEVQKVVSAQTKLFPAVSDVTFRITMENVGDVTLTGVQLADDIASAMAPAVIVGTPVVSASGFAVDNTVNAAYDGTNALDTLSGNADLPVGATGVVDITVRLDFTAGFPGAPNTAFGTADQITVPVASDFPLATIEDPTDQNPTPVPIVDTDNDGAPDGLESNTTDRDGDGIVDSEDYDPTGYFFCEEDGSILSGGLISVEGPAGTQTGLGSSNNITILRDGSDGFFQFFVSQAGTYRLVPTYPTSGAVSTDRLPSSTPLDVSTFLPSDPGVLGSGEVGNTGVLADFSDTVNSPFYLEFDIEEGDPTIFNNNLPLMHCGTPVVAATKTLESGPEVQPNGASRLTYRVSAQNVGPTLIQDVRLVDDLAAAFADADVTAVSWTIDAAPNGFGATPSILFDGVSTTDLLTSGGDLAPGETVTLDLVIDVSSVSGGTYTNLVQAGGSSPLDDSPIAFADAEADATVAALTVFQPLIVTKVSDRSTIKIGEAMRYTVTVTNSVDRTRSGLEIVDRLPPGFVYVPGTGTYGDGAPDEPDVEGRDLIWRDRTLLGNESVTLTLVARAGAAAVGTDTFINQAFVGDGNGLVSNVATASVSFEVEPVFDCGDIIGKVFDDRNRNGYQDAGEPGLPGVRLATVRGLLITTDAFGRYHVTCAQVPDVDIGSNFLLKLDARTLPTGYRITTENPRVVRLTRGKVTKLNFGASVSRVVRLDLAGGAFAADGSGLNAQWDAGIDQLIVVLSKEPSVLRLTYQRGAEPRALVDERMRAVSRLVEERWQQRDGRYRLEIEQMLVGGQ